MKSKRKNKIILLLVILILALNVGQAYGDNIKDLKNKQNNIKNQIKNTQTEIKDLEAKSNSLTKEIADLDQRMNTASLELGKVEEELDTIEKSIEKNEADLIEAEENLGEREDLFRSRLRVMYMNGNVGYLELLLTSENIKDFFSRREMVQAIAEHDTELITYMKEQRDIIEEKKVELKAQRASVEVARNKLKSRKDDLAKASREKELAMGRLESDKQALEKEVDKFNSDSKKLETQIINAQKALEAQKPGGSQGSNNPYTGGKMLWPVPGHSKISSYFGYRVHPVLNKPKLHTGIDIPAPTGTAILAASSGTVISSGWIGSYGNAVIIDHGGGIATLYGHNSQLLVSVGQKVSQGATIAKAGSTGMSTGPHCHFEVRKNGAYVDPLPWLRGN